MSFLSVPTLRGLTVALVFSGAAAGCKHGEPAADGAASSASAPSADTAAASGDAAGPGGTPARGTPAAEAAAAKTALRASSVVAVAPFSGGGGEPGWLGLLMADHVARALTAAGGADPETTPPVNVFGWRQTASAARAVDIAPADYGAQADKLLREMGADALIAGTFEIDGARVTLRWQTIGSAGSVPHELRVATKDLSKTAYEIGAAALADLGKSPVEGEVAPVLPGPAAQSWGRSLEILARQSQTTRAGVVLPKADRLKAGVTLEQVTKVVPLFGPAWAARAVIEVMNDDWDAANAALTKAEAVVDAADPASAIARFYVYVRTARQDQALEVLRAAVEAHPGALEVLGYLGDAYYSMKFYDKALPVFEEYLKRVPKSPYAARRRDAVLARLGRKDEALRNAEALVAQYPRSVTVLAALASRQIDAKQLDKARATLERGLEKNPDHPLLLTRLSYVELESGDADKALALAEKAVALLGKGRGEPVAGYAHVDLARALAVAGRRDEAKASLITAIRLGIGVFDIDRVANDPRLEGFIEFPIDLPAEE